MKTTLNAKILIETDKYLDYYEDTTDTANKRLTLAAIEEEIKQGNYKIEWINSYFSVNSSPTIIIKI